MWLGGSAGVASALRVHDGAQVHGDSWLESDNLKVLSSKKEGSCRLPSTITWGQLNSSQKARRSHERMARNDGMRQSPVSWRFAGWKGEGHERAGIEAEVEEEEEKGRMRRAELKVEKFTSRDRHRILACNWRVADWRLGAPIERRNFGEEKRAMEDEAQWNEDEKWLI